MFVHRFVPSCAGSRANGSPRFGCGGPELPVTSLSWPPVSFCLSNTVGETLLEGEHIVGGRGGALFNGAYGTFNRGYPTGDSTVVFKRKAIFKDNVGALVSQTSERQSPCS